MILFKRGIKNWKQQVSKQQKQMNTKIILWLNENNENKSQSFVQTVLNIWNPTAIFINEHNSFKINYSNMKINILRIENNIIAQPIFRKCKLFQNIFQTVL